MATKTKKIKITEILPGSDSQLKLRDNQLEISEILLDDEYLDFPQKLIDPPGTLVLLDELSRRAPDHHALVYLRDRGYDPIKLSKYWDVSYCPHSHFRHARDRIIIPLHSGQFFEKIMVGWQARFIGDSIDGLSLKEADIPKYYTSPGFKRKYAPYNFDRAVRHRMVVIVEGPVDVWNVGPMAIGTLGQTLSQPMVCRLVGSLLEIHEGEDPLIVVCLDPKQDEQRTRRRKPHPIEELRERLGRVFAGPVVPVYLPEDSDPGSLARGALRNHIREACVRVGCKADFGQPKPIDFEANY